MQSSHSAGELAEVTVHYRWHPLHGQRVRILRRQPGTTGVQIFYELADGSRSALPEWMTDAGRCAATTLGSPVVDVAALVELRELLDANGGPGAVERASMDSKEVKDAEADTVNAASAKPVGSVLMRVHVRHHSQPGTATGTGEEPRGAAATSGKSPDTRGCGRQGGVR